MQQNPSYDDVVSEVIDFLARQAGAAIDEGIDRRRLCVDPGFGFGKTLEHNLALLAQLRRIQDELGLPVLAGLSRKTMIGKLTDKPVEQRMAGSIAAAIFAVSEGARIVRVHDVAETVDAIKVWQAANQAALAVDVIHKN
jgi:dihydropteroate synthase